MSVFDYVVWIVAILLAIPVLLSPVGWAAGAVVVVGWLLVAYGGRELIDLEKQRREGERGMAKQYRRGGGGDGQ